MIVPPDNMVTILTTRLPIHGFGCPLDLEKPRILAQLESRLPDKPYTPGPLYKELFPVDASRHKDSIYFWFVISWHRPSIHALDQQ